jgi:hypothetical protein
MNGERYTTEDARRLPIDWADPRIVTRYGPKLGAEGLGVYWALAHHRNANNECGESLETLGDLIDMSRNTLKKYLARLEDFGLIARRQMLMRDGKRVWYGYVFTLLDLPDASYERAVAGGTDVPLSNFDTYGTDVPLSNFDGCQKLTPLPYRREEDDRRTRPDPEGDPEPDLALSTLPPSSESIRTPEEEDWGVHWEDADANGNDPAPVQPEAPTVFDDPLACAFPTPDVAHALALVQELMHLNHKPRAHPRSCSATNSPICARCLSTSATCSIATSTAR